MFIYCNNNRRQLWLQGIPARGAPGRHLCRRCSANRSWTVQVTCSFCHSSFTTPCCFTYLFASATDEWTVLMPLLLLLQTKERPINIPARISVAQFLRTFLFRFLYLSTYWFFHDLYNWEVCCSFWSYERAGSVQSVSVEKLT